MNEIVCELFIHRKLLSSSPPDFRLTRYAQLMCSVEARLEVKFLERVLSGSYWGKMELGKEQKIEQLEKVLHSRTLQNSENLKAFLRFVVEKTLADEDCAAQGVHDRHGGLWSPE